MRRISRHIPFTRVRLISRYVVMRVVAFNFIRSKDQPANFRCVVRVAIPIRHMGRQRFTQLRVKSVPFNIFHSSMHAIREAITTIRCLWIRLLVKHSVVASVRSHRGVTRVVGRITMLMSVGQIRIRLRAAMYNALFSNGGARLIIWLGSSANMISEDQRIIGRTINVVQTIRTLTMAM